MVRVRVLAAGLVLLAVGSMVLGWGSRSRQMAATSAASQQLLPAGPVATPSVAQMKHDSPAHALAVLAALPLMFEPNEGQANLDPSDARAKFMARGSGYGLFLGSEGATLTLATHDSHSSKRSRSSAHVEALQMKLAGANRNASLTGADPLPSKSNYFIGSDPATWRHGIPQFARVSYRNIYPGINLVFYGKQGHLEYDFQVAPGSDPSQAELEFDGAKRLELQDGALVIRGEGSSVRLDAPRVYQEIAGRQEPVEGSFVLRGAHRAGFAIGAYDHSRELVIDPVLTFSTYFGGSGNEVNSSVALDGAGNIYLSGSTTSPTLPGTSTTSYQQTAPGTQNVYIAKIDPVANPAQLVSVTYLGGTGPDIPAGVAVDGAQNVFVAGTTSSANFPHTSTAYQTAPLPGSTGPQHVFVTELQADFSTLAYSSYLSGNGADFASGMTIDAGGNIYVTGTTTSNNPADTATGVQFPASTIPVSTQAFQPFSEAAIQFFVTKINTRVPAASSVAYSTYFGGGNFVAPLVATGGGIAVDTNGNIYFSGTTNFLYSGGNTADFPIKNAYQPCLNNAPPAVIVNPPTCSTTGTTSFTDAFATKLLAPNVNTQAGSGQIGWSTYVGGTQNDSSTGIAVDSGAANIYITGTTDSPDVTTISTFGQFQHCLDGPNVALGGTCPTLGTPAPTDAYVARLTNPTSTTITNMSLTYFSYLGGTSNEAGLAITVDNSSGALVTGWTTSSDFPVYPITSNDIQGVYGGNQDAFVARLNTATVSGQTTTGSWATYFGGAGVDEGTGVALDTNQNVYLAGDTNSPGLATNLITALAGQQDAFVGQVSSAASLAITGVISLGTGQTYISAGNQATFTYTLTNNGPDLANNITFTDNLDVNITKVALNVLSAAASNGGTCSGAGSTSTNVTCSIQSLQAGSTATVTVVVVPTPTSTGLSEQFNGGAVSAKATDSITSPTISVAAFMSDFSISVSPSNVAVQAAGQSAHYQIQLTPNPVYGSSISLSVSGLPTASGSSFSTNPVTLPGNSPASTTLTISTTARPIVTPAAALAGTRHFYALWLCVSGLTLLGIGVGGSHRRRRIAGILMFCALFAMLLLQPACSSTTTSPPANGTPAGTYTLVIAAGSGGDTKNATVQLTVP